MGYIKNMILTGTLAAGFLFMGGLGVKQMIDYHSEKASCRLDTWESSRAYSLHKILQDSSAISGYSKERYIEIKKEYENLITDNNTKRSVDVLAKETKVNELSTVMTIFGLLFGIISSGFFVGGIKDYLDERKKKYSAKPAGLTIPAEKEKPSELETKACEPIQPTTQNPVTPAKKIIDPWSVDIPEIKNEMYHS
jgi:hypothetical protein